MSISFGDSLIPQTSKQYIQIHHWRKTAKYASPIWYREIHSTIITGYTIVQQSSEQSIIKPLLGVSHTSHMHTKTHHWRKTANGHFQLGIVIFCPYFAFSKAIHFQIVQ